MKAIEVRRSPRRKRTVAARLDNGTLVVYLPERMSKAEESQWINKMRLRLEAQERRTMLNSSGDLEARARDLNRRYFDGRLIWKSIEYVTNQNSRYGSCTTGEGTIRIADCLAGMPGWVRDYVIVHELAHLEVPDHSKRFWKLVDKYPLTERARGFLIAKGLES
ncbi:MAG TPA: M48 family metallopeptidase [Actinomycetota bacterium]|nr:M48 family metallopeptidase [Actinomycetota bacterium]